MFANAKRKTPSSKKQSKSEPADKNEVEIPVFVKKILKECMLVLPKDGDVVIGPGRVIEIDGAAQTLGKGTQKKVTITYVGGVPIKICFS